MMTRQMKPSDVTWAAQFPAGWSTRRVKEICTYVSGDTPDTGKSEFYTDSSNGYPWMTIRDLGQKVVMSSKNHLSDAGVQSKKMVLQPPGTLMMSFKLSVGITSIAGVACYTNEAVASFKGLYNPYWYYALGPTVSYNAKENIYGSPLLNKALILNAPVAVPPMKEQVAIASFLDDRTTAIDSKIQLLEEKATALADLRKSVIHQAVTKGLDSNVGMKSSGVEWIGDVPTHWSILRGKQFMTYKKELNRDKKHTRIWSLTMDGVRENDPDNPIGMVPSDYGTYQLFNKGDFVFKLIDLENYKTSRFGIVPDEGIMSSAYMRMQVQSGISAYLKWVFLDMWRLGVFNAQGSNGVRSNLTYSDMYDMVYAFPPDTEQKIVAAYLDSKIATIEESINTIIAQLEALKSLRQSIIHEAVTGKIDVADHGYHYA